MHSPSVPVPVKRLPHFEGLELPAYATDGAAGMEFLRAIPPQCTEWHDLMDAPF